MDVRDTLLLVPTVIELLPDDENTSTPAASAVALGGAPSPLIE
jgi:hypothetical protein